MSGILNFWNETELKARSWYAISSTKAASLDNWYVSTSNRVVRPAISLKSCVKWSSGNGSANSPYESKSMVDAKQKKLEIEFFYLLNVLTNLSSL